MNVYVVFLEFFDGSIHEIEVEAESFDEALDKAMPIHLRGFELDE